MFLAGRIDKAKLYQMMQLLRCMRVLAMLNLQSLSLVKLWKWINCEGKITFFRQEEFRNSCMKLQQISGIMHHKLEGLQISKAPADVL